MNTHTLFHRLDTRLAACAAAAGASLAVAPSSDAVVVYEARTIAIPVDADGIYLNVVTGITGTSSASTAGWDVNPFGSSTLIWFAPTPNASGGYIANFPGGSSATLVDNLPLGAVVNPASTFVFNNQSETTGLTAFNSNSTNNYVGFRFLHEPSGIVMAGWVQLRLGADLTDPARAIVAIAYETTGGPLLVGQIPEPASLTLLGLAAAGAVGIRAWRKRKEV